MEIKNKKYSITDLNSLKKAYPDIPKAYFPDLNHKILSFELVNSCTSFANAIRRSCTNEIFVKYLDITHLKTNDKYQINEVIINRINQIPLVQTIDINTELYLHVVNETDDMMDVMTSDIKLVKSKTKNKITTEELKYTYFNNNIRLCTIRPNTFMTLHFNIKIDNGKNDAKYSLCCVEYDILDADYTTSTLNQNNTHFYLSIESFGNLEPSEIIKLSTQTLTERLNKIKNNLNNDEINITLENKIKQYQIKNESHTIANMLAEYIYNIDNDIELVNIEYSVVPRVEFFLCLIHENPKSIINKAIDNIIKDLNHLAKLIN